MIPITHVYFNVAPSRTSIKVILNGDMNKDDIIKALANKLLVAPEKIVILDEGRSITLTRGEISISDLMKRGPAFVRVMP